MAVRKLSVSMPEDVVERALRSALAGEVSLSTWLTEAARERMDRELKMDVGYQAARELVMEYEAEHGPISAEARAWSARVMADTISEPEG